MEALLYFLFWGGLLFLMMRFGCGAHLVAGHRGRGGDPGASSDGGLRWVAPARDTDPVCGKTVRTADAKPSVHDGHVYYFCSRECREVFEAAPDLYIGGLGQGDSREDSGQKPLEHHHA
ncbi:YHS domain-containing protein [Ferruginivarius sediminum]|uniref:YHS domain-containing protein n=1 Tax=Ferruginivarius sediminum TaxID=2661937 RepID=A0A369TGL7_9PROT|nr:YHS domain-containing protein [Ferruginivarius sediminum]RDD62056.1 YHS domain-containing protein [Ferruginivarius sediminum]